MIPRLSRAPLFLQVLALALLCVIVAQGVNAFVVLGLPEPPTRGFSVTEAARALRGETVALRSGGRLNARVVAAEPAWTREGPPFGGLLRRLLAAELGVAPDKVRVAVRLPRRLVERIAVHERATRAGEVRVRRELRILHEGGPHGSPRSRPREADVFTAAVFPPFSAAVQRSDGRWSVVEPPRTLLDPWQRRLLISFALTGLLIAPLAWWFARRLTRPIRAFAGAAERLGADPSAPPMQADGPPEVRTAVAAFNDMQEKLRAHVQGRTEMVAAIAHDLRTPLTRLRFRAESAPEALRDRMTADIAEMDGMIASVLAFVRAETARDARTPVDLAALAAAVADDFAEHGRAASLDDTVPVTFTGDPLALKRLLANLVDNALKYGGAARLSLAREPDAAVLTVDDDGPGLPETELERVFEPFRRAEPSRNRDTGGAGLGLAVARAIARAHGGDVTLRNRPEGGLRAEVRLPL